MTVYIGSAAFVAQLQRERDELLMENLKLHKQIADNACDICGKDAQEGTNGFQVCVTCYANIASKILKGQERQ